MLLMVHSKEMIQDNFLLLSLPLLPPTPRDDDKTGRLKSKSQSVSGDRGSVSASFDHISKGGGLFIYSMLGEGAWGKNGRLVSEIAVFLLLVGIGAGYMVFISTNFSSALKDLNYDLLAVWKVVVVPVIPCLLSLLRTYDGLSKVAGLGIFCVAAALIIIFTFGPLESSFQDVGDLDAANLSELPGVLGVSAFLLAIQPAVMSFAEETDDKAVLKSALKWGCGIVVVMNIALAVFGYFSWGSSTNPYIFCNIESEGLVIATKFLLVIELMCSLPLALRPNIEMLEKAMGLEAGGPWQTELKHNVVRVGIALLSYVLTVGIPVFNDLLTLTGGVCGSAVGFVLPPLVHASLLKKFGEDELMGYSSQSERLRAIALDYALATVGIGIMGWTLYGSLQVLMNGSEDGAGSDC